jgi:2-succinyl-6-hydroxy-2,4-cyclohexadiene-1-carboxylate synthase
MRIRSRGIYYHLQKHGDDPAKATLVMLHGFLGSGEIFNRLIPELTPFINPVTIDLMGHGRSEGQELHYQFSPKEQIAGLDGVLREVSPAPIILYGYSMGARLALMYALAKRDNVLGLVLESGTFGIESEQERQSRQELDKERAERIIGDYEGFLDQWAGMPLMKQSTDQHLRNIQSAQQPQWMANSLLGFGTGEMPNLKPELSTLECPVLLMAGAEDAKFCRINQAMHKELPDSELHIMPEAGHRVHNDRPEEISKALRQFIKNKLAL